MMRVKQCVEILYVHIGIYEIKHVLKVILSVIDQFVLQNAWFMCL